MTADTIHAPAARRSASRAGLRFVAAFVAGLAATLLLGAGALSAYDRQYQGRILPGVRVGAIDVSGLSADAARERLAAGFADAAGGEVVLTGAGREWVIPFSAFERRVDVDALVSEALAVGRAGGPAERAVGNVRTALRGVELAPRVRFDRDALAERVRAAAAELVAAPKDASVAVTDSGFGLTGGADGRTADPEPAVLAAAAAVGRLDPPARVTIEIPVRTITPVITTEEASAARDAGERIAQDLTIKVGDDSAAITGATIRSWLRMAPTVDGEYVPVLDVTKVPAVVESIAKDMRQSPRNAAFVMSKDNQVLRITPAANGRRVNLESTTKLVTDALLARRAATGPATVDAAVTVLEPLLSTAEAKKAAPRMTRVSTWTTGFVVSEKNGFGANIWIPADDIDGYVVGPGEWFDFWEAVGPVTRERGYRDGGAIINGRTEPQGALAGGICSTSTTLFNAALRAGFEMGDRRNHFYYIDRYPLGLDATVFKSSSGSVQTMSWRNDTRYPVVIRGIRIRDGGRAAVRFDLYSVPTGRTVSLTDPIVKNVTAATDSVEYTDDLPTGQSERIETPVDGKDVWVSRVVRDANGDELHRETYASSYATITGVVRIGTG